MAGQECDCDFLTSGTNVIDLIILKEYEEKNVRQPIEMRYGNALWIFDKFANDKDYLVCADVARGDGSDYSAAHVLELETLTQVAEYHDFVGTKEFGDILVNLATEYNDACLLIERENIGWAVLQQVIDREYKNLFYCSNDLKVVEVQRQLTNRYQKEDQKLLPGFSTTIKTRQLVINKIESYVKERMVDIRSIRTINELKTFVWENGKAQAAENYNDDLVMALGLGLWVRDTALRLRNEGILLTRKMLDKIHVTQQQNQTPVYSTRTAKIQQGAKEQWEMKFGNKPGDVESLTWLLR
jgi:hypothetical protein